MVEIPVLGVRIGRGPVQYNALASDHANELDRLLRVRWRRFWEGRDFVGHAHTYTSEGGLAGAPVSA